MGYAVKESKTQAVYETIITEGLTYLEGFYGVVEYDKVNQNFIITKFRDSKDGGKKIPTKMYINRSELNILIGIIKGYK